MRECPNCHEPVGEDPFCPNCGCRLPEAAPEPAPAAAPAGPAAPQAPDPGPAQTYGGNPNPVPNFGGNPNPNSNPAPNFGGNPNPNFVNPAPGPNPFDPAAPQQTAKPPKKGGKPSAKVIAICGAAVAVAVVVLLAVLLWPKSAVAKFEDYQRDAIIEPVLDAAVGVVNNTRKAKLKTDLTITADVDDRSISRLLDDSSIVLKVDLNKAGAVINAAVNFMGSEILTGTLTYGDGKLGFQLPEADDTYYLIDVMELMADELDLDSGHELPDVTAKELKGIANKYIDEIFKTVNKDNLKVDKDGSVKYAVLRGRADCTVYTFKPSAGDVEDLLERIADRLEADKKLREVLVEFSRYAGEELSESEVQGMLEDAADTLRDNARDAGRTVKAAGFEWVLAMEGKAIRSLTVAADDEIYGFETDGTLKKGMDFAVYSETDWGVSTLLEGDVRRDGKKLEGHIGFGGGESFSADFDVNLGKTSPLGFPYGSYSFTYNDYWYGEYTLDMEVESVKGGADHILTFGGDALDTDLEGLEITVNASNKGTAKKPKDKGVDISDYSADELEALFRDLGETLGRDLMDEVGGFLY